MTQTSVLVVEDNDLERQITAETLREEGFRVDEAPNGKRAMEQLALGRFDVVLTDLMMPGMSGEELLAAVRQAHPASQVVVLTAHGTIDSAVKAMKTGAFSYLTKPTDRETLVMTVTKAAELASLAQENMLLRTRLEGKFEIEGIVGQHPAIQEVIRIVRKVAPSNSTVLIQGESGTGKEVIARSIHRLSPRAARPFVAINCSAIPDNLIENELFGHERGAFTGATERKIGLIETADKSTLFLDEIADLNIGLQSKILRVLQERELRRVGGNESIRVDVRLVAATNRNLAEEVTEGRFREDLYYRINVVTITLPPLRERRSDIPLLAEHALHHKFAHLAQGRVREISREAMEVLLDYPWPGNVRQLESAIERALLLCEGDRIMPKDLPHEVLARKTLGRGGGSERARSERFEIPGEGINFEQFERDLILQAMERAEWVIAKAAKLLGMSYRTLQYRLDKFGIKKPDGPRPQAADAKA
ncbi:MAG TPA: sigma-54 dependent transcriptional regulator [Candidatus Binataceae bacterium]|nr:sigma-54 dependent transcriptional regulator [Candidatus Binataceae bacterium]